MAIAAQSVAAKIGRKSDNGQYQVLCRIKRLPAACSELVTKSETSDCRTSLSVNLRAMSERVLRLVTHRKPVPILRDGYHKDYPEQSLSAYVTETLECGHRLDVFSHDAEPLIAKRRNCPDCAALPRKKHAQSVRLVTERNVAVTDAKPTIELVPDSLCDAIRDQLEKAEEAQSEKKQFARLEKARDLSRRLREHKGESVWIAIGFAICMAVIFAAFIIRSTPKFYMYYAPDDQFRVIREIDPYAFVLQHVHKGIPQPAEVRYFCRDYRPHLEAGMTLTYFAYDDRGSCISIVAGDRRYDILRDDQNLYPVIPKNCQHTDLEDRDKDHIVCLGTPQFN